MKRISYKSKWIAERTKCLELERKLRWWQNNAHEPLWRFGQDLLVRFEDEPPRTVKLDDGRIVTAYFVSALNMAVRIIETSMKR